MDMVIQLAIGLALGYIFASTTYNLFFHPLAKYPGPFWCRVSGIPSFYHACFGNRHIWLWQQFQIYGSTFRAAPNVLLFNTPEAWNDIFDRKANVKKSGFYEAWRRNEHDLSTLNCTDVALHAKKRSLLNLAFTEKSLIAAGPYMSRHIDRWNELLLGETKNADGWSEPRDISTWSDHLLFDLLGDLCFGAKFGSKEPGENKLKTIPHAIAEYMKFFYPFSRSPLLDLVLWLKPRGLDALMQHAMPKDLEEYFAFVGDTVTRRVEVERQREKENVAPERQDMFHFLCTARNPDTGELAFNTTELHAEASLLIIAGSDTTASAMCAVFFYICHYPQAYAKLVAEIREKFSSPEEIVQGPALLTECKYLRACFDEAIRMAPPGPSELERTVLAGGATIADEVVPEGTNVGVVHWALGRNEEFFGADVNVYRPERWIIADNPVDGNPAQEVKRLKWAVQPFGKGVGSCIGQKVAMLQLSMAIARTLWRFDVRIAPGQNLGEGRPELGWGRRDRNTYMVRDAYISLREGPILQFRGRKRA